MLRPLATFAAALMTLAAPLAAQAGGLTTAPANNGTGGIFLDLTPATASLFFEVFETPTAAAVGVPIQVEVWTRPGSYVGFTTSNAGWTLAQTVSKGRRRNQHPGALHADPAPHLAGRHHDGRLSARHHGRRGDSLYRHRRRPAADHLVQRRHHLVQRRFQNGSRTLRRNAVHAAHVLTIQYSTTPVTLETFGVE